MSTPAGVSRLLSRLCGWLPRRGALRVGLLFPVASHRGCHAAPRPPSAPRAAGGVQVHHAVVDRGFTFIQTWRYKVPRGTMGRGSALCDVSDIQRRLPRPVSADQASHGVRHAWLGQLVRVSFSQDLHLNDEEGLGCPAFAKHEGIHRAKHSSRAAHPRCGRSRDAKMARN